MKKIEIVTYEDKDYEIFQQLINNNSENLTSLQLWHKTFTAVPFHDLPKLTEIELLHCSGNIGLNSLFSRASNLKKLKLIDMKLDAAIAATAGSLKDLEELKLNYCSGEIATLLSRTTNVKKLKLRKLKLDAVTARAVGYLKKLEELEIRGCKEEISTLLTEAATNISTLVLYAINENISVEVPFTKMKKLKIQRCRGEWSSLLTQAAPYITNLDLEKCVDKNNSSNNPFNNLQVLIIRESRSQWICREIDIKESPLLFRGGRLEEFDVKVKRIWEEDYV